MNMHSGSAPVVLRNMEMSAHPLRIGHKPGRTVAPAPAEVPLGGKQATTLADTDRALEQVLAQARSEGTRVGREEGLRAGHDEGLRLGLAAAQEANRAAVEKAVAGATAALRQREDELQALAASIAEQQTRWHAAVEDEAVALGYEVACNVLGDALLTPEGIRSQSVRLFAAAADRRAVFHVHPADADLLQSCASSTGLRWVADPAVEIGGCMLKGAGGTLDARLETLLAESMQGLLQVRAHRVSSSAGEEA